MISTIISVIMILCNLYYCIFILFQKRSAFMLSSVGSALLAYLLFSQHIYINAILNIAFIVINTWLFIRWKQTGDKPHVEIGSKRVNLIFFASMAILALILGKIFTYTDNPMPYMDALATSLAIIGSIMMDKRYLEHAFYALLSHITMIVTLVILHDYIDTITYVIWALSALARIFIWTKYYKKQQNKIEAN